MSLRKYVIRRSLEKMRHLTEDKKGVMPVTIRRYRPDDLESCRSLWVELTEWHRQIYQSPEIGAPDPGRYFDAHLDRVGPERVWVAEVGGQVVGMAGLVPGEHEAELEPLVVSERHRGSGIGPKLVKAVVEAARASGVNHLKVRPVARNGLAIRFFHREGFDVLGQIELLIDFKAVERQDWRVGERIANRDFRV